ncbi:hypothetical protein A4X13_0g7872 [Tilletia indica]|uniref:Core-binding (CB) domain-containing protein n=1 Tax=Tilletia indica TaxID=43049 RepID=A0A177T4D7_9BASI|nr:hypothetical protein A4X13_0g7872 [Tilletia indica]
MPHGNAEFNNDDDDVVQIFGEPVWTPQGWSLTPTRMLEAAELSMQLYTEGQPDVTARIHAIHRIHLNDVQNPQPAHYRSLEVRTDRLAADISDELVLVHNLLVNWSDTHERIARVPWQAENEENAAEQLSDPGPPEPPSATTSRRAEKRRASPSPSNAPAEKRGRVEANSGTMVSSAAAEDARPDGKRKSVTIHFGVCSSEGAGSLRPPKKTIKKLVDLEFIPLWLLSKDACRRAAEKETGFKKPMLQNPDGTFVEVDEACPDGYIPEGDLNWMLWNDCTTMQETLMTEYRVDEDIQKMFKAAHSAIFNHTLAESQRAALQRYFAWNRSTWCRKYQLITQSGSDEAIFDLAVVSPTDLDVYVRAEEERVRKEQDKKLAAMQARVDELLAAGASRQVEVHTPLVRSSSTTKNSKAKRHADRNSFRTEIAGVASAGKSNACASAPRTRPSHAATGPTDPSSSRTAALPSASTSTVADPALTKAAPVIDALSAASRRMALRLAGARNELPPRPSLLTLKADVWASILGELGLDGRYEDVVRGLREGFDFEIPRINRTAIAKNAPSATIHREALSEIVFKERERGAYIGPFDLPADVQAVLHNHFQSMPLSLIPKPPDKFRLIQNFSANVGTSQATNELIPRSWATTWSTFRQIVADVLGLPSDSEACTRDVDSAYRLLPVHPSQWPAMVLRTEQGYFIDTRVPFGIGPGTGVFGRVGEAALDIFRAQGLGPLGRWVDDILFFRVREESIADVNSRRAATYASMDDQPFLRRGGKWWVDADGNRHDESYEYPLRDRAESRRADGWHYGDEEIEAWAGRLGLPLHKPTLWSSVFTYAGYVFNIRDRQAGLPVTKAATYCDDIHDWLSSPTHRLEDAQRLLGRLLHASPVVPDSSRHLTRLISFVNVAIKSNAHARSKRHGGSPLDEDLLWWRERLSGGEVWCSIAQYAPQDIQLYVDASSEWGVGIWWGGRVASYRLRSDWRTRQEGRDIQFAEALAIEVGLLHVFATGVRRAALIVHTDNTGVQFGVPRGRMRNAPATTVIERIHALQVEYDVVVHTRRPTLRQSLNQRGGRAPTADDRAESRATKVRVLARSQTSRPSVVALRLSRQAAAPTPALDPPDAASNRRRFVPQPLKIGSSPLRPDVPAPARLAAWRPITAHTSEHLSPAEVASVSAAMASSYSEDTRRSYGSGLARWHQWCDVRVVPEQLRCPAPAELLEYFIIQHAGSFSSDTISTWLSGLRAWHRVWGQTWPVGDMRRAELVARLDSPGDVAAAAAAATAFWGLLRLGEATCSNGGFDPKKNISRNGVTLAAAHGGALTATLALPFTKTNPNGQKVVLTERPSAVDPLLWLQRHLALNTVPENDAHSLFAFQRGRGVTQMKRSTLTSRLKILTRRAEVPVLDGHSFRIGGCTELLRAGNAFDDVRVHGRWSSEAWQRYVREHAEIMAPRLHLDDSALARLAAAEQG